METIVTRFRVGESYRTQRDGLFGTLMAIIPDMPEVCLVWRVYHDGGVFLEAKTQKRYSILHTNAEGRHFAGAWNFIYTPKVHKLPSVWTSIFQRSNGEVAYGGFHATQELAKKNGEISSSNSYKFIYVQEIPIEVTV